MGYWSDQFGSDDDFGSYESEGESGYDSLDYYDRYGNKWDGRKRKWYDDEGNCCGSRTPASKLRVRADDVYSEDEELFTEYEDDEEERLAEAERAFDRKRERILNERLSPAEAAAKAALFAHSSDVRARASRELGGKEPWSRLSWAQRLAHVEGCIHADSADRRHQRTAMPAAPQTFMRAPTANQASSAARRTSLPAPPQLGSVGRKRNFELSFSGDTARACSYCGKVLMTAAGRRQHEIAVHEKIQRGHVFPSTPVWGSPFPPRNGAAPPVQRRPRSGSNSGSGIRSVIEGFPIKRAPDEPFRMNPFRMNRSG